MFVMGCYGHKLSNGVLFAHHLILGVPGGSSHLAYRRRVGLSHNPPTRVNDNEGDAETVTDEAFTAPTKTRRELRVL